MTAPVGSISDVASGIQWRDLVDQLMAIEQSRSLTPVNNARDAANKKVGAWQQFQGLAAKLRDAAAVLKDSAAYTAATVSVPSSAASALSASASASAVPGRYDVDVLQLARTDKVGGAVVTDPAVALGATGSVVVNGRAVSIGATDSLNTIRDKFNAANTGAAPSGVTATILGGKGAARLVLTASDTGADGVELADGTAGTLAALGLDDGTASANIRMSGEMQSYRATSATIAIAVSLGVTVPTPSTMRVGGTVISVDLALDSLSAIAARINLALGQSDAARIVTETANGRTQSRLVTTVPVEPDATVDAAASARSLQLLGFTRSGRGGVAQVVASASAYTDGGVPATTTSLLSSLGTSGGGLNLAVGDVISLQGTRGDGTAVNRSLTVGAGTTVQDVLNAMNNASGGLGGGTRTATASLAVDGRIKVTDSLTGDSLLGISLTVAKAGGGTSTLGAFGTTNGVVGRTVSISSGQDASVKVDGRVFNGRTNSVSEAVGGVTLDLRATTTGAPVSITVQRDTDTIVKNVQAMTAAYNTLRSWVTTNTAAGSVLALDGTVRTMASTITSGILTSVTGLPSGSASNASLFGLEHDKAGVLSVNVAAFTKALTTQPAAVQGIFGQTGDATDSEVSFVTAGVRTQPSATPYALAITQAATQASASGAVWSTYATTGAPDTMTITDRSGGSVASILLANGDSIDTVVARLNAEFGARGLGISASKSVDSRLRLQAADFGSAAGFTLAYTPGVGGDGTAALGLAAGVTSGLDVAGTINGIAGTGAGQALTGGSGDASDGLVVRYTGTTARAAGTVRFSLGINGLVARLADALSAGGSTSTGGTSNTDTQITNLQKRISSLALQVNDVQSRLDARKATLTKQFIAMESAIARTNAIAASLTSQINGLTSRSN